MKSRKFFSALALTLGFIGTGCALEGASSEDESEGAHAEDVGEVSSALFANEVCPANTECFDRTDSTGSIRVRWYRCPWSAAGSRASASCSVGSGFALVGGGAEVEGSTHPGHLLESSWPSGDSWTASSKQLVFAQNLRLRAFAIGLQLNGLTKAQLKAQVKRRLFTSAGTEAFPAVAGTAPANEVILSGGALASSATSAAQVLVHSFPTGGTGWAVYGKQHMMADPGNVSVMVMSMPMCPTGLAWCVARTWFSSQGASGGGYQSGTASVSDASWVMTGVGAISHSNNNQSNAGGRPLTDLVPKFTGDGATAITKDHHFVDPGSTQVFVNAIRRL